MFLSYEKGRMDNKKWHNDPEIAKYLTLIGQTGLMMAGCIVVSVLIGIWLDHRSGSSPLFLAIFCIVGVLSGFFGVYKMIARFYNSDRASEKEEKQS